jgi:hypothetical protein
MKKLIFTGFLFGSFLLLFQTAKAQNIPENVKPLTFDQSSPDFLQYRERWNLKFGAGIGATYRSRETLLNTAQVSFSAEPSYRLTNYITVGVKGEYTLMRPYTSKAGRVKADPIASLSATADVVKLWKHKYAPFLGLGAGFYRLGYGQILADPGQPGENRPDSRKNLGTRFGVSPRIGINIEHFSLALEVNLIDEKVYHNRDYATIKIGYTL